MGKRGGTPSSGSRSAKACKIEALGPWAGRMVDAIQWGSKTNGTHLSYCVFDCFCVQSCWELGGALAVETASFRLTVVNSRHEIHSSRRTWNSHIM